MNSTEVWIGKFKSRDQAFIKELISKFEVVSLSTLVDDLQSETKYQLINNASGTDSIAVIESVISVSDVKSYFKNHKKNTPDENKMPSTPININHWNAVKEYFGKKSADRNVYKAYIEYLPTLARSKESGSEHFTDLIKRQLFEELSSWQNSSIERSNIVEVDELQDNEEKPIDFYLLVDNIGSGKQVASFLFSAIYGLQQKFGNKPNISVSIISWCATNSAIRRIKRLFKVIQSGNEAYAKYNYRLIFLNYTKTLDDVYPQESRAFARNRIISVSKGVSDAYVLGFEGAATMILFESMKCPNTTPGIFYFTKSHVGPLFKSRYVHKNFKSEIDKFDSQSSQMGGLNDYRKMLSAARKKNILLPYRAAYELDVLKYQVLSHFELDRDRMVALALCPGLRSEKIRIEKELREEGFIDDKCKVLEPGLLELKKFGRVNRYKLLDEKFSKQAKLTRIDTAGNLYYPTSLDGVN